MVDLIHFVKSELNYQDDKKQIVKKVKKIISNHKKNMLGRDSLLSINSNSGLRQSHMFQTTQNDLDFVI